MDATDAAILRLLSWNPEDPRHHDRGFLRPWDVAKRLGLHRNTVVRRLDALREQGVYRGTVLYPSPDVTGGRMALFEFAFDAPHAKTEGLKRLRADPRVHEIQDFLGDLAWAPIHAEDDAALAKAAEELRQASGARSVHKLSTWDWPRLRGKPPTPLDQRILDALSDDAHRPVAEVAEETGVTPKTVRLRLCALAKAHAFTVAPALDLARVRGAIAFVLTLRFPDAHRDAGHAAIHDVFPHLVMVGGPHEETTWAFLTAPDAAGVEAARERAASLPGANDARVLLVKAMLDC